MVLGLLISILKVPTSECMVVGIFGNNVEARSSITSPYCCGSMCHKQSSQHACCAKHEAADKMTSL